MVNKQHYGNTEITTKMVLCVFVCRYAASVKDGSQYFVLLIITDGVISDMAQTKESIVNVRASVVAVNTWSCTLTPPKKKGKDSTPTIAVALAKWPPNYK